MPGGQQRLGMCDGVGKVLLLIRADRHGAAGGVNELVEHGDRDDDGRRAGHRTSVRSMQDLRMTRGRSNPSSHNVSASTM